MYRNAVQYKGIWLAPGSLGFQLHSDKKFGILDQHMKAVAEKDRLLSTVVCDKPKPIGDNW